MSKKSKGKPVFPQLNGGYHVCDTVYVLDELKLPFRLDESLKLSRPTNAQIIHLRETAKWANFSLKPLENELRKEASPNNPTAFSIHHDPLPPEKLRFLLMTYSGNGLEAHEFSKFASTLNPPMHFAISAHTTGRFGSGKAMSRGFPNLYHQKSPTQEFEWVTNKLTNVDLKTIRSAWLKFKGYKTEFPFLEKAASFLYDLNMIPRHHDLYFLGLFAILELMLTHKPGDRDNADSLNHQIKTKVPLLTKRMLQKPNYTQFDQSAGEEKLWTLLYGVRSDIAHGTKLAFGNAKYKILKDRENALTFLDHATRCIVFHAIHEPKLIADLKLI